MPYSLSNPFERDGRIEEPPLLDLEYYPDEIKELKRFLVKEDPKTNEITLRKRGWIGNTWYDRIYKDVSVTIVPSRSDKQYFVLKSASVVYGFFTPRKANNLLRNFIHETNKSIEYKNAVGLKRASNNTIGFEVQGEKLSPSQLGKVICSIYGLERRLLHLD